jgi:hypothetical protein
MLSRTILFLSYISLIIYRDLKISGTYFSSGDSTSGDNSFGVSFSGGLFSRDIIHNFG